VISAAENSNKFQKPRFWKEKSVEDTRPKFSKCLHLRSFYQPQQTEGKGKKKNVGPKPFCLAKLARIDLFVFVQF
jgi:hypothetical protein